MHDKLALQYVTCRLTAPCRLGRDLAGGHRAQTQRMLAEQLRRSAVTRITDPPPHPRRTHPRHGNVGAHMRTRLGDDAGTAVPPLIRTER
jgi:hypothetical protein